MPGQQMQAVDEDPMALDESMRADYDGLRVLPIVDRASADGHLRLALSDLDALLQQERALLPLDNPIPVRVRASVVPEQLGYPAHLPLIARSDPQRDGCTPRQRRSQPISGPDRARPSWSCRCRKMDPAR